MTKRTIKWLFILVICLMFENVYATDSIYSINKNTDEKLFFIKESFNKNNENNGFVVGGTYLKEIIEADSKTIEDYQVMIVNYKKDGRIKWNYDYGLSSQDSLYFLEYSYDENNNVDGYLLGLSKSYNVLENTQPINQIVFQKLDKEGNLLWEKDSNLFDCNINKIVSINNNGQIEYLIISTLDKENKSIIGKYDKELNLIWTKDIIKNELKTNLIDIMPIYNNATLIGYSAIKEYYENDSIKKELIKLDTEGNEVKVINDSLEKYEVVKLQESTNGFILYGITNEVKIDNGKTSYFIINYNIDDEEVWETVGDVPLDESNIIYLITDKEKELNKYYLMYNRKETKTEVVQIDTDGTINKKIKKINNDYYDINNFYFKDDIIYLIGQINCPKDDTCEYDNNSLFLVSDEDKVIEVKENDSTTILIIITIIVSVLMSGIYLKKRKKSK